MVSRMLRLRVTCLLLQRASSVANCICQFSLGFTFRSLFHRRSSRYLSSTHQQFMSNEKTVAPTVRRIFFSPTFSHCYAKRPHITSDNSSLSGRPTSPEVFCFAAGLFLSFCHPHACLPYDSLAPCRKYIGGGALGVALKWAFTFYSPIP